eukprot:TRINITY_DN37097_c0_g1_i2.p1 TRINITY_DN37097_c0_g1~~TRINITY_DN37097_c0_g1_i2.p1  ORF type:complete len:672 (+),score=93.64 TRINITY_DN37097_c0_g1_i2:53-2068(+)
MTRSILPFLCLLPLVLASRVGLEDVGPEDAVPNRPGWTLYSVDAPSCGFCGSIAIDDLKVESDLHVGCISSSSRLDIPTCPFHEDADKDQAGGHAGTILKLTGDRIAKMTKAFDEESETSPASKIEAGRSEHQAYMEMWCLRRLSALAANGTAAIALPGGRLPHDVAEKVQNHNLRKFALGERPWAPAYFGVCRAPQQELLYGVMENVLSHFLKPCQLDLKLGFSTVKPWDRLSSVPSSWKARLNRIKKQLVHRTADSVSPSRSQGARLAGFKVYNPFQQHWEKMSSKMFSPLTPLDQVFDVFLDVPGHKDDLRTLQKFRERLLEMAAWWGDVGRDAFHTIALSGLFVYECQVQPAGTLLVSNIETKDALLPTRTRNGSLNPYLAIASHPGRKVYPDMLTRSGSSFPNNNSKSSGLLVTSTSFEDRSPSWPGLQFGIDFSERIEEVVLEIWDKADKADDYIGQVSMPVQTVLQTGGQEVCLPVKFCVRCAKQGLAPQLCFNVWRGQYPPGNVVKKAHPLLKLIDYAHFFTQAETPDWDRDGVYEGLLSAMSQFDKMEAMSSGAPMENGKAFKCARESARDPELSEASCKQLGKARRKAYATWQASSDGLGYCRTCDELRRRKGTWRSVWRIYRNNEQEARMHQDEEPIQQTLFNALSPRRKTAEATPNWGK